MRLGGRKMDNGKTDRVLGIYTKLLNGEVVNKAYEANLYEVNERTIQRDVDDIRNFLKSFSDSDEVGNEIVYDRMEKGYRLEQERQAKLSNGETLAICKILLDSRALLKDEMAEILDKIIDCCVPKDNQKGIKDLVRNEMFHYVGPRHKTPLMETMWKLGEAIRNHNIVEISYERTKDREVVSRKLKPVAIMFSEYYFYVTAFIDDKKLPEFFDVANDPSPTIYRIDRIKELKILNEQFRVPYSSRFEEGEFRKRVQFMYGGKLQKIKFKYSGSDVDAVLDRLPTAVILDEDNGTYTISAETFGKGIEMWIRSQGDMITLE